MAPATTERPNPGADLPPLRRARAESLEKELRKRHYLVLDEDQYRWWREDGWSRAAVDRAVEDLVETGRARLDGSYRTVTVHVVAEEQEG
jgi:hypothetical protein